MADKSFKILEETPIPQNSSFKILEETPITGAPPFLPLNPGDAAKNAVELAKTIEPGVPFSDEDKAALASLIELGVSIPAGILGGPGGGIATGGIGGFLAKQGTRLAGLREPISMDTISSDINNETLSALFGVGFGQGLSKAGEVVGVGTDLLKRGSNTLAEAGLSALDSLKNKVGIVTEDIGALRKTIPLKGGASETIADVANRIPQEDLLRVQGNKAPFRQLLDNTVDKNREVGSNIEKTINKVKGQLKGSSTTLRDVFTDLKNIAEDSPQTTFLEQQLSEFLPGVSTNEIRTILKEERRSILEQVLSPRDVRLYDEAQATVSQYNNLVAKQRLAAMDTDGVVPQITIPKSLERKYALARDHVSEIENQINERGFEIDDLLNFKRRFEGKVNYNKSADADLNNRNRVYSELATIFRDKASEVASSASPEIATELQILNRQFGDTKRLIPLFEKRAGQEIQATKQVPNILSPIKALFGETNITPKDRLEVAQGVSDLPGILAKKISVGSGLSGFFNAAGKLARTTAILKDPIARSALQQIPEVADVLLNFSYNASEEMMKAKLGELVSQFPDLFEPSNVPGVTSSVTHNEGTYIADPEERKIFGITTLDKISSSIERSKAKDALNRDGKVLPQYLNNIQPSKPKQTSSSLDSDVSSVVKTEDGDKRQEYKY